MQGGFQNIKSVLTEKWIVCRVCLKQPDNELIMHAIFNEDDDKDMTKMLFECGGVPIRKFDHYPDKICDKCLKYLRIAYRFRLACQRSYQHLSRLVAPVVIDGSTSVQIDNDSFLLGENDDYHVEGQPFVLKLEPLEEVSVKLENAEQTDEEVLEVYEPMDEDSESMQYELDELELTSNSPDVMTLNEFDYDTVNTSDEECMPNDVDIEPLLKVRSKSDLCVLSQQNPTEQTPQQQKLSTQKRNAPVQAHWQPQQQKKQIKQELESNRITTETTTKLAQALSASTGIVKTQLKRGPKPKLKKDNTYICDICGNIYPSQGRLTEHIKLHLGIKPHKCEICGYAFSQTQQLDRHMNTHTGNRPYKCKYCSAAFADLSTRNKHHRIHTNERPYVCDVCGKAFTYTNTLKFHKMIHTGEKPFVCETCGKGFQQAYKLRNHMMTHMRKSIKQEKIEIVETIDNFDVNTIAVSQILEI